MGWIYPSLFGPQYPHSESFCEHFLVSLRDLSPSPTIIGAEIRVNTTIYSHANSLIQSGNRTQLSSVTEWHTKRYTNMSQPYTVMSQLCLFVCLFVCLGKTRKSILRPLCLEGSNNPWEWLHTESGTEIELYPRRSCFQHENRPENTPRPRA